MVSWGRSSTVRASPCQGESWEFESPRPRHMESEPVRNWAGLLNQAYLPGYGFRVIRSPPFCWYSPIAEAATSKVVQCRCKSYYQYHEPLYPNLAEGSDLKSLQVSVRVRREVPHDFAKSGLRRCPFKAVIMGSNPIVVTIWGISANGSTLRLQRSRLGSIP
jgi:hypothetical protein